MVPFSNTYSISYWSSSPNKELSFSLSTNIELPSTEALGTKENSSCNLKLNFSKNCFNFEVTYKHIFSLKQKKNLELEYFQGEVESGGKTEKGKSMEVWYNPKQGNFVFTSYLSNFVICCSLMGCIF